MGPVKCCLYKQVIVIYRWSLDKVSLYYNNMLLEKDSKRATETDSYKKVELDLGYFEKLNPGLGQ